MKGKCEDCEFYVVFREPRPYGSTVAYEELAECENPELPPEIEKVIYGEGLPVKDCPVWLKRNK